MPLDIWLAFAAAALVIIAIPGPTVILVLAYGLAQGRRVALASALGVALGDLIAISASLAGLGALLLGSYGSASGSCAARRRKSRHPAPAPHPGKAPRRAVCSCMPRS